MKLSQYLGGSISWIALALATSRSIHFQWTINLKNFLGETPKAHFKGYSQVIISASQKLSSEDHQYVDLLPLNS